MKGNKLRFPLDEKNGQGSDPPEHELQHVCQKSDRTLILGHSILGYSIPGYSILDQGMLGQLSLTGLGCDGFIWVDRASLFRSTT